MDELILKETIIFLTAVSIIVPIFHYLKLGSILGYLIAGFIIGPNTFGLIANLEYANIIAEFGIIFLLFSIGLELSLERLKTMRYYILVYGNMQIFITGFVIYAIMRASHVTHNTATVISLGMALSSTALALQVLIQQQEQHSRIGRISLAILLMQDLMVVPLLILLQIIADEASINITNIGKITSKSVLVIFGALLLGQIVRPVFRTIATTKNNDLLTALTLLLVLGISFIINQAGLSLELGAFLAGLLLAETEYRLQVETDIRPLRGLFIGVFFMMIGMNINIAIIKSHVVILLLSLMLLLALKATVLIAICRIFRVPFNLAVQIAVLLSQAGEFGFILFNTAAKYKLISHEASQLLFAIIALSISVTPALVKITTKLANKFLQHKSQTALLTEETEDLSNHVIVAGYGRIGKAVVRILNICEIAVVALDLDYQKVKHAKHSGNQVFFGDASRLELLVSAGLNRAKAVIVLFDSTIATNNAVAKIRSINKDILIFARAYDKEHKVMLLKLGANAVFPETNEVSIQISKSFLTQLGKDSSEIEILVNNIRRDNYSLLEI